MIEIRKLNDHTVSITRIWFKWYLDETLDLDLWADDIGEGHGAGGRVIGGGMLSTPDNAVVWMCVCSQNPYLEILTCKVMVLESGAFGRVTLTIINGIIALVKRGLREIPPPFCHVRTQQENGHPQTKKWLFTRHWTCQHFDLGLPRVWNCEKFLLFISYPVCSNLL